MMRSRWFRPVLTLVPVATLHGGAPIAATLAPIAFVTSLQQTPFLRSHLIRHRFRPHHSRRLFLNQGQAIIVQSRFLFGLLDYMRS